MKGERRATGGYAGRTPGRKLALFLSKYVYPWAGAQMRQSNVPALRWLATSGDGREPERTPA